MSMGGEIEVVPARDDIRQTAALHVAELPHGLFPRLGKRFVDRWHRAHITSKYGVVLVARQADEVVGFVLGTTDRQANVAWIIEHHRRELLVTAIRALASRPKVAAQFLRTRVPRYTQRLVVRPASSARLTPQGEVPQAGGTPIAVLEAVAVAPAVRGQTIGTALVEAFLAVVAGAGAERAELVTKAGPEGAAGFYEHGGWRQVGDHVDRDGDWVLTYRIDPRCVETR